MKKILLSICGAVLVCGFGFQAQANTILTSSGAGPAVNITSTGNFGYDFTVGSTPLLITALGLWDGPSALQNAAIGDGFIGEHVIGLWDNSGTLLAKATMQIGTGDTLLGEFRYSSVLTTIPPGPLILSANTKYVLGAAYVANDPDPLRLGLGPNQPAYDPAVSPGFSRIGPNFAFPSASASPGAFVGPNAQFTLVTNGNGVPEGGSTVLLLGAAFAVVFGFCFALFQPRTLSREER